MSARGGLYTDTGYIDVYTSIQQPDSFVKPTRRVSTAAQGIPVPALAGTKRLVASSMRLAFSLATYLMN